jgi:hypothetical protein
MKKLWAVTCVLVVVVSGAGTVHADDANSAGPKWDSMKPSEFVWMAKSLTGDDAAVKAARTEVVSRLTARYMADAAGTRAVTCREWKELTDLLAKDLTADQRSTWVGKVRQAYVQDADALALVKTRDDLQDVVGTLSGLGDSQAQAVVETFAKDGDSWKTWPAVDVAGLAQALAKLGQQGSAGRQRVLAQVTTAYLASAAAAKAVTTAQWQDLAQSLGKDLSAEAKTAWLGTLKDAFAGGDLTRAQFGELAGAAAALGDASAVSSWATATAAWRAWDAGALADLATELAGAGDGAKATRLALVGHVADKFLVDASTIVSAGTDSWRKLTAALAKDLTADARAQWAAKLRGAFLADGTALKDRLSVEGLSDALGSLGDATAGGVVAAYMAASTGWQSWNAGDLAWLAERLSAVGDSGKAARQGLIQHLAGKLLADPKATKTAGAKAWASMCRFLAKDLPAEDRGVWVTKLIDAFAGSPESLGGLGSDEMASLNEAMTALGSEAKGTDLAIALVDKSAAWKEWSPDALSWLTGTLRRAAEAGKAARLKVFDHITAKYLDDLAKAKDVSIDRWADFANCLGGDLPPEGRQLWAFKIRAAFAGTTAAQAALQLGQLSRLVETITRLGDLQAGELAAMVVNSTDTWQSWPVEATRSLSGMMPATGSGPAQARRRLIDYIGSKFMPDAGAIRKTPCQEWSRLTEVFGRHMEPGTRAQWLQKLRGAFAPSSEVVAGLALEEMKDLVGSIRNLGSGDGPEIVAAFVRKTDKWQASKPEDLAWLAEQLAGSGDGGRSARQRLVDHISANCLATTESIRAIQISQWRTVCQKLGDLLTPELRAAWSAKLRDALAGGDTALRSMKAADVQDLVSAIAILRGPDSAALAASWMENRDAWAAAPADVLASLAEVVVTQGSDKEKTASLMTDLDAHFSARHAAKPLPWGHCDLIKRVWRYAGNMPKARQWALRGYESALGSEQARDAADNGTMMGTAVMLEWIGLTGKGKGYPLFATALVGAAVRDKVNSDVWWLPGSFSKPLGTPETQQTVRAVLLDGDGNPRPIVAKTLGWAYKQYGDFEAWRKYVTDQTELAPDGTDSKALWLLAKAYTEALVPPRIQLALGKGYMDQALGAAKSEAVRVKALADLAMYYRWIDRPGVAIDLLENSKGQLGDQSLARINEIQADLRQDEDRRQAAYARRQIEWPRQNKQAMLADLRQRLARADKSKNAQDSARLSAQIQRMEQGLGE